MVMVSDDGIYVGEAADKLKRAFSVSNKLLALGFKNGDEEVQWRSKYEHGDGWSVADIQEQTATDIASAIVKAGITEKANIYSEKIPTSLVVPNSLYAHRIGIPSGAVDIQKLEALVSATKPAGP